MVNSPLILVVAATFLILSAPRNSYAEVQSPPWNEKMKQLSATLVDAYPFFFTKTAFRQAENDRTVRRLIAEMRSNTHEIPVSAGERLLGSEPLIAQARDQMSKSFSEAESAFKVKDYDRSQTLIQQGVGMCVACHTAQGYGRHFQKRNDEMFNMFTPTEDKVTGLLAIRQFDSALAAIENSFSQKSKHKDSASQLHQLNKLYLVISVRAEANIERAKSFLKTASQNRNLKAVDKDSALEWGRQLTKWELIKNQPPEQQLVWLTAEKGKETGDRTFLYNLISTRILHQSFVEKMTAEEKSSAYLKLALAYDQLKLPQLDPLAKIYARACLKVAKLPTVRTECQTIL